MRKLSDALPAYLGGKRRLAPLIFALLASRVPRCGWAKLPFVDPFLGGGSMSLLAKAYGFEVHCNDLAYRSALVGHALIANCSITLTHADLALLFREPDRDYCHTAENGSRRRYSAVSTPASWTGACIGLAREPSPRPSAIWWSCCWCAGLCGASR